LVVSPVRDSESTTSSLLAAFPPPRLPFYHSRQPSYAQSNGVGVDNAEQNSRGSEVIEVAASGNALTDQALLSANSYINYTDENGCTPLLCCKKVTFCYCGAAHCCSRSNIDLASTTSANTPIFTTVAENGHVAIVAQLIVARCNVNLARIDGVTPFLKVVIKGHRVVVNMLIPCQPCSQGCKI
jgi:serine/threonine-protein phosphatase 6 regulatory ankyrin repeat subunit B